MRRAPSRRAPLRQAPLRRALTREATGSVPRGTLPVVVLGGLLGAVIAFGELVHTVADHRARQELRRHRTTDGGSGSGGACAVVVLGFANRGTRANPVNHWRARIAVRTAERYRASGDSVVIVCCGGAVRGDVPEADLLEKAVREIGWSGEVLLDRTSTSTWENIQNARRLVDGVDRIAICSNGLHAAKARSYLRRQDPVLGSVLAPADEYRAGEMALWKPLFAAVGLWKLFQVRRVSRGTTR